MKIGDKVKEFTTALGMEQCDPCKDRQRRLNEIGDRLIELFGKTAGRETTITKEVSDE